MNVYKQQCQDRHAPRDFAFDSIAVAYFLGDWSRFKVWLTLQQNRDICHGVSVPAQVVGR